MFDFGYWVPRSLTYSLCGFNGSGRTSGSRHGLNLNPFFIGQLPYIGLFVGGGYGQYSRSVYSVVIPHHPRTWRFLVGS